MKTNRKQLALALTLAFAQSPQAATFVWDCNGDSYWDIPSCWNPDGTPASTDVVNVGSAFFGGLVASRTLTIDIQTANAFASSLNLDNTGSHQVSISQIGGTLHVSNNEILGSNGIGNYAHSSGTNSAAGGLYLGYNTAGTGNYNLTGGTLAVGWEHVGLDGRGTFTQSGGSHTVGIDLNLGYSAGSTGSYTLSNGSLSAQYQNIGVAGTGTFSQGAGTNTVTQSLSLGQGTYTLAGGTLNVASIINAAGTGRLYMDGGTLNLTGGSMALDFFTVGNVGGSNASFTLASGKSLTVANEFVGSSGAGTFTQNGGSHVVTNALTLGNTAGSLGIYTLNGGNLSTVNFTLGEAGVGQFFQNGGVHTVSGTLTMGVTSLLGLPSSTGYYGYYSLDGGTLNVGSIATGAGNSYLFLNGGTLNLTGNAIAVDRLYVNGGHPAGFTLGAGKSLTTELMVVGAGTSGSFSQVAGTNTAQSLTVGEANGGEGRYVQSGGVLSVQSEAIGGSGGTGYFSQSGGNHTVSGQLILGGESYFDAFGTTTYGYYELAGGSLTTASEKLGFVHASGTFTQTGGTHTVTGDLSLGTGPDGAGFYHLLAGTLNVGSISSGHDATNSSMLTIDHGTLNLTGSSIDVKSFTIGTDPNFTGSFTLGNNQSLTVATEDLGQSATSSLVQNGGTHTVTGSLTLGRYATGSGTYVLNAGSLSVPGIATGAGTGSFYLNGGTLELTGSAISLTKFAVGDAALSDGSFTLGSGQSLVAGSETIGNAGKGSLNQTGGNHTVSGLLVLGNTYGGIGSYTLSGGNLSTNTVMVGLAGNGSGNFVQSGGTHTVSHDLLLGWNFGDARGSYTLSGGTLNVAGAIYGGFGSSTLNLDGGILNVTGDVIGISVFNLANSAGTEAFFSLGSGKNLKAGIENIGKSGIGLFVQTGGTNTVANLSLGSSGGIGAYSLVGGQLSAGQVDIGSAGSGNFVQTGGTHAVSGNLLLGIHGGGGNNATGTYTLNGGALTVAGVFQHDGILTVGGGATGAVGGAFNIYSSGVVNMNGGTLAVDALDQRGVINFNAGVVNVTTDLSLHGLGSPGSLLLPRFATLSVGGTTRLNDFSTLTVNGASFSTGSLVDNGGFAFNSGIFNLTGDNLVIGSGGLFGAAVQFAANQTINVSNTTTIDNGGVLQLNGSAFGSGTTNNNGQVVLNGLFSNLGGGTLNNTGKISGSGQISAGLNNLASGELRAIGGDALVLSGAGNTNRGRITLLDGAVDSALGLTNSDSGRISGRGVVTTGATAATGLMNQGEIDISGTTDFIGHVSNTGAGKIVVSGAATATFHDDVIHNGSEIRVSGGSQAVFFGSVSGAGAYTGTGTLYFEGGVLPGNSPALVPIAGDLVLGALSVTTMELGGLARGTQYDAFDVTGALSLNGTLSVVLYDLGGGTFMPQAGDSFDLFTATVLQGSFSQVDYAPLQPNLAWHIAYLTDAVGSTDVVRLSVAAVPEPETYAMMLAGLGLIGALARRRRVNWRVNSPSAVQSRPQAATGS